VATKLYRLGGWAFENKRKVLALWAVVLIAVAASAAAFGGQKSNKFEVPGTESQQATDLLNEKFPGTGGASARIVFKAPAGQTLADPENQAAVEATLKQAKVADDVEQVTEPTLNADKTLAFADVIYPVPADQIDDPRPRRARRHGQARPRRRVAGRVRRRPRHRDAVEQLRGDRHDGRLRRAGDHAGVAARGRPAAADRSDRRPHRRGRIDRTLRRHGRVRDRADPGDDARPRGRQSTTRCSSCRAIARTSRAGWSRARPPHGRPPRPAAPSCSPA